MAESVNTKNKAFQQLLKLMLNPWVVLSGIILGGLVGWYLPGVAVHLAPLGNLYSSLLQMCVIPILLTAVISSLSRLFIFGRATNYLTKVLTTILLGLILASAVGITAGILGNPGSSLQESAQATLGTMISEYEISDNNATNGQEETGLLLFLDAMVPDNIFASLSQGERLSVLFFSMLVGIALGSTGHGMAQPVLVILEALYEAFIRIITWLMYGLPLGLFCLAAGQISDLGVEILGATIKLCLLIYLCALLLILFYTFVIAWKSGRGVIQTLFFLQETLVVAIGTSSSFAAIPSAMRSLKEEFKLSRDVTDLVLPLGVTLNPPGSVFHFALSTLFIADIYAVEMEIHHYIIIFIGAILAGIAASGAPGVAAISMIAIILQPLGLPVDVALILLVAIDPIVDPLLTTVNVHANCATTVLIAS